MLIVLQYTQQEKRVLYLGFSWRLLKLLRIIRVSSFDGTMTLSFFFVIWTIFTILGIMHMYFLKIQSN